MSACVPSKTNGFQVSSPSLPSIHLLPLPPPWVVVRLKSSQLLQVFLSLFFSFSSQLFQQHERNRSVTFLKARIPIYFAIFATTIFILGPPLLQRKNGLFKKAYELGVLCSVDVAVIIFGIFISFTTLFPADPCSIFIAQRNALDTISSSTNTAPLISMTLSSAIFAYVSIFLLALNLHSFITARW